MTPISDSARIINEPTAAALAYGARGVEAVRWACGWPILETLSVKATGWQEGMSTSSMLFFF